VVERALDLFEFLDMLPCAVANGLEVGDDRVERAMLTEEDAELERVLVHGRPDLLETGAQALFAGRS